MTYQVIIKPSAEKALRRIQRNDQLAIARRIDSLANQPRPGDAVKLKGSTGFYRVRVGDYRVIYQIRDKVLIVLVLAIGHRRDVYRNL